MVTLDSTVAVSDDAIITADFQGYVHWLDKASGALAARIQSGKVRVSNPPVVAGNLVLVMNDKGRITAFRATPLKTASAAKEPAPATAPAAAPTPATAPAPTPGDTTGVPPASPPDLPPAPDKKTIPENTPMTPEERK